jgi:hypothetical protein
MNHKHFTLLITKNSGSFDALANGSVADDVDVKKGN